jgi:superfamily II DNA/RNA helicase
MSDMGFLPCVRRIVDQTRADRQTVLFSATLDGAADDLARTHLREPIRHSVAPKEEDAGKATHLFWTADTAQRSDLSAQIVRRAGRTVLFTRTKHGADRLTDKLNALGVRAAVIHGGRSQQQRDRSLADFHRGHVAALVATDVAARGIHVEKVACVVHFDLPDSPTDYQHRSGRTARAGERGMVVSLVTPDQRRHARNVQRHFGFPAGHSKPDVERIEVGAVAPVVEVEHRADDRSFGERPRTGGGGGVRRALGRDTGPRRFDTRRDATGTRRFANDRDAAEPRRFDDGRPAARPAPIDRAPGERRSRYSRVRTEATPRATESPWRDDRSAPGRAPTDQPARAARPYDGGPRDGRSTRPPKPAGPHRPGRPAAAPRRSGRPAR